jgi:sulfonate transport system substrate-binding protein
MLFKKFLLCLCLLAPGLTIGQNLVKMKAGMVAGVDQIGLPIALERGFFEKWGLDVTISRPYATGVDALNSLQAGENDMLQVGVPMIGAVLRGIDLVALGNYSGSAHKMGGDATIALIAGSTSGIVKGDLKTLKGKKIAASFGTINHLYVLGLLEKAGLTPADVTLVNTPPPDMTVALLAKGIDAFACWDPVPIIALKDVPGAVEIIRGGDIISYVGFNVALGHGSKRMALPLKSFLQLCPKQINGCGPIPKLRLKLQLAGFQV